MAIASPTLSEQLKYPTTDGKPMAESDVHRELMYALIKRLQFRFAKLPKMYVSGNLLLFYVKGNKRKHVSPDVFVVPGASKEQRLNFLVWVEKRTPAFIIEVTSASTKAEDILTKFVLYRDVLKVKEYFLYDPYGDYLDPQLQGYRLHRGDYLPIDAVAGRLPSRVVGLHLEPAGKDLRLYDPATDECVPNPEERAEKVLQENARLRAEIESLRQPKHDKKNGR